MMERTASEETEGAGDCARDVTADRKSTSATKSCRRGNRAFVSLRHDAALKSKRSAKADLSVIEVERIKGAAVVTPQIIRSYCPKSSDGDVNRRLEEVVVVGSIGRNAVAYAKIIGTLKADRGAEINPLKQSLPRSQDQTRA